MVGVIVGLVVVGAHLLLSAIVDSVFAYSRRIVCGSKQHAYILSFVGCLGWLVSAIVFVRLLFLWAASDCMEGGNHLPRGRGPD